MIIPWTPSLTNLTRDWRAALAAEPCAVVLFWGVWSPPDQHLAHELERVVSDFIPHLTFFAANIDEEWVWKAAHEAEVFTNPTLVFFRFGEPKERFVGLLRNADLASKLESWLSGDRPQ